MDISRTLFRRSRALVAMIALVAAVPWTAGAEGESVAFRYTNDFETTAGNEWSTPTRAKTPNGRSFLGEFHNRSVTNLTLTGLPPASQVTVAFDLYVFRSWDGNNTAAGTGPDLFDLDVAGGTSLVHTSFSNSPSVQSYPGSHPAASNPARTGAIGTNTLGYPTALGGDAVYRITSTFPWNGPALQLRFSAAGAGPASSADEGWGIDNVSVTAAQACGSACVVTVLRSKMNDVVVAGAGTPTELASVSVEYGAVRAETGGWYVEQGLFVPRSALLPDPNDMDQSVNGVDVTYDTRLQFCVDAVCRFTLGPPGESTGGTKVGELWDGRIQVWQNGQKLSDIPAVVFQAASA